MADIDLLSPLLTTQAQLQLEAKKRKDLFDHISVKKGLEEEYYEDRWNFERELKTKIKLRKAKKIDEVLENRCWLLMHLLGYAEMNSGRQFTIEIQRHNAEPLRKQIDIFAKDDETVIIGECKASNTLTKRSLQKDIEEFANLKSPLSKAIKKHYGTEFNPKIIWIFFTHNVIWSKPDLERAKGENIHVVKDKELRYYSQIANHLRGAARYQFLAEFLKGMKVPELDNKVLPAIRGKLGGQKFYCFVTTPKQLLKISFVNHRSLSDPEGAPTYQRLMTKTRLRQIGNFLKKGGFFPTNILVNFTSKLRFDLISKNSQSEGGDVAFGHIYLPSTYRSAWIIDGQHRLYGYAPLDENYLDQNIIVLAFEKMSKEQEADLFLTINHEQKSVPKTLLDELEGELKWGSKIPSERIGAISAKLLELLKTDIGEPLYGRISAQGIKGDEKTCLTVPQLKIGLRQSGLLGSSIHGNKSYLMGPLSGSTDTETLDRGRHTLNTYFDLIKSSNLPLWDMGRNGFLCTNIALNGYIFLFAALIEYAAMKKHLKPIKLTTDELVFEISEYLEPVTAWLLEASVDNMERMFKVQFGSGGPKEYFYRLCNLVHQEFDDFYPEGMEDWQKERSSERTQRTNELLESLNIIIQKYIFDAFKNIYGMEKDAYFEKGVPPGSKIHSKAYEKSQQTPLDERLSLDHYLDFIDYKKIVENKQNWDLFKSVFNIPLEGIKGQAKNLIWMDDINEIRRVPAHATEKRRYKIDQMQFVEEIYSEFSTRLKVETGDEYFEHIIEA